VGRFVLRLEATPGDVLYVGRMGMVRPVEHALVYAERELAAEVAKNWTGGGQLQVFDLDAADEEDPALELCAEILATYRQLMAERWEKPVPADMTPRESAVRQGALLLFRTLSDEGRANHGQDTGV